MNHLEKIIFLELTNKQFAISQNSEYYKTYELLNQEEKDLIDYEISNQIHDIWTRINTKQTDITNKYNINSIEEYHSQISPINKYILKVCNDFDITLKRELSDKFKKAVAELLGKDFLNKF